MAKYNSLKDRYLGIEAPTSTEESNELTGSDNRIQGNLEQNDYYQQGYYDRINTDDRVEAMQEGEGLFTDVRVFTEDDSVSLQENAGQAVDFGDFLYHEDYAQANVIEFEDKDGNTVRLRREELTDEDATKNTFIEGLKKKNFDSLNVGFYNTDKGVDSVAAPDAVIGSNGSIKDFLAHRAEKVDDIDYLKGYRFNITSTADDINSEDEGVIDRILAGESTQTARGQHSMFHDKNTIETPYDYYAFQVNRINQANGNQITKQFLDEQKEQAEAERKKEINNNVFSKGKNIVSTVGNEATAIISALGIGAIKEIDEFGTALIDNDWSTFRDTPFSNYQEAYDNQIKLAQESQEKGQLFYGVGALLQNTISMGSWVAAAGVSALQGGARATTSVQENLMLDDLENKHGVRFTRENLESNKDTLSDEEYNLIKKNFELTDKFEDGGIKNFLDTDLKTNDGFGGYGGFTQGELNLGDNILAAGIELILTRDGKKALKVAKYAPNKTIKGLGETVGDKLNSIDEALRVGATRLRTDRVGIIKDGVQSATKAASNLRSNLKTASESIAKQRAKKFSVSGATATVKSVGEGVVQAGGNLFRGVNNIQDTLRSLSGPFDALVDTMFLPYNIAKGSSEFVFKIPKIIGKTKKAAFNAAEVISDPNSANLLRNANMASRAASGAKAVGSSIAGGAVDLATFLPASALKLYRMNTAYEVYGVPHEWANNRIEEIKNKPPENRTFKDSFDVQMLRAMNSSNPVEAMIKMGKASNLVLTATVGQFAYSQNKYLRQIGYAANVGKYNEDVAELDRMAADIQGLRSQIEGAEEGQDRNALIAQESSLREQYSLYQDRMSTGSPFVDMVLQTGGLMAIQYGLTRSLKTATTNAKGFNRFTDLIDPSVQGGLVYAGVAYGHLIDSDLSDTEKAQYLYTFQALERVGDRVGDVFFKRANDIVLEKAFRNPALKNIDMKAMQDYVNKMEANGVPKDHVAKTYAELVWAKAFAQKDASFIKKVRTGMADIGTGHFAVKMGNNFLTEGFSEAGQTILQEGTGGELTAEAMAGTAQAFVIGGLFGLVMGDILGTTTDFLGNTTYSVKDTFADAKVTGDFSPSSTIRNFKENSWRHSLRSYQNKVDSTVNPALESMGLKTRIRPVWVNRVAKKSSGGIAVESPAYESYKTETGTSKEDWENHKKAKHNNSTQTFYYEDKGEIMMVSFVPSNLSRFQVANINGEDVVGVATDDSFVVLRQEENPFYNSDAQQIEAALFDDMEIETAYPIEQVSLYEDHEAEVRNGKAYVRKNEYKSTEQEVEEVVAADPEKALMVIKNSERQLAIAVKANNKFIKEVRIGKGRYQKLGDITIEEQEEIDAVKKIAGGDKIVQLPTSAASLRKIPEGMKSMFVGAARAIDAESAKWEPITRLKGDVAFVRPRIVVGAGVAQILETGRKIPVIYDNKQSIRTNQQVNKLTELKDRIANRRKVEEEQTKAVEQELRAAQAKRNGGQDVVIDGDTATLGAAPETTGLVESNVATGNSSDVTTGATTVIGESRPTVTNRVKEDIEEPTLYVKESPKTIEVQLLLEGDKNPGAVKANKEIDKEVAEQEAKEEAELDVERAKEKAKTDKAKKSKTKAKPKKTKEQKNFEKLTDYAQQVETLTEQALDPAVQSDRGAYIKILSERNALIKKANKLADKNSFQRIDESLPSSSESTETQVPVNVDTTEVNIPVNIVESEVAEVLQGEVVAQEEVAEIVNELEVTEVPSVENVDKAAKKKEAIKKILANMDYNYIQQSNDLTDEGKEAILGLQRDGALRFEDGRLKLGNITEEENYITILQLLYPYGNKEIRQGIGSFIEATAPNESWARADGQIVENFYWRSGSGQQSFSSNEQDDPEELREENQEGSVITTELSVGGSLAEQLGSASISDSIRTGAFSAFDRIKDDLEKLESTKAADIKKFVTDYLRVKEPGRRTLNLFAGSFKDIKTKKGAIKAIEELESTLLSAVEESPEMLLQGDVEPVNIKNFLNSRSGRYVSGRGFDNVYKATLAKIFNTHKARQSAKAKKGVKDADLSAIVSNNNIALNAVNNIISAPIVNNEKEEAVIDFNEDDILTLRNYYNEKGLDRSDFPAIVEDELKGRLFQYAAQTRSSLDLEIADDQEFDSDFRVLFSTEIIDKLKGDVPKPKNMKTVITRTPGSLYDSSKKAPYELDDPVISKPIAKKLKVSARNLEKSIVESPTVMGYLERLADQEIDGESLVDSLTEKDIRNLELMKKRIEKNTEKKELTFTTNEDGSSAQDLITGDTGIEIRSERIREELQGGDNALTVADIENIEFNAEERRKENNRKRKELIDTRDKVSDLVAKNVMKYKEVEDIIYRKGKKEGINALDNLTAPQSFVPSKLSEDIRSTLASVYPNREELLPSTQEVFDEMISEAKASPYGATYQELVDNAKARIKAEDGNISNVFGSMFDDYNIAPLESEVENKPTKNC